MILGENRAHSGNSCYLDFFNRYMSLDYYFAWYFFLVFSQILVFSSWSPPPPHGKVHVRCRCITWFTVLLRAFLNGKYYCLWYCFEEDILSFHLNPIVILSDQYGCHCSSLKHKNKLVFHHFSLNDALSFSPVASRNMRDTTYNYCHTH